MRKFWWILRAYLHMRSLVGWSRWSICESLYETFSDWPPKTAVEEDISYWY